MTRVTFLLIPACVVASAYGQPSEQIEFFEKKIRPILVRSCQGCHNQKAKTAGLDLSTPEGIQQGGTSGPLVLRNEPKNSLLLRVIRYYDKLKMPPGGKLPDADIGDIEAWITAGAHLPAPQQAAQVRPAAKKREFTEAERRFWAFQKIANPAPPAVKNRGWVKSPIDHFILAKLEEKGLQAPPMADRLTLLRRVTYDLTGLPPSESEVLQFLSDKSPKAFEAAVDRLLASPRYGEKWGRHWLDVARYADSTGNDEDHRYPYAWRYRDYVIEAFNNDLPYDQFIREQIAGDLMPAPDGSAINKRGVVATGFLALGPKALAQQDKQKMLYDTYDEQVDVVSRAVMGVTVACARCHDHKFDPILTKDYYSLVSIFASTKSFKDPEPHVSEMLFTPLLPKAEYEKYLKEREVADDKKAEIDDFIQTQMEAYRSGLAVRLAEYMLAAKRVYAEGGDGATLATELKLSEGVLKKFISYLKPSGEDQPHLAQWHSADAANAAGAAQAYQKRFEARLAEYAKYMANLRSTEPRVRRKANMPPPMFERDKDRFFYEVYFEGPMMLPNRERETVFSAEARQKLASLRTELKAIEATLPPEPDMACAVEEGAPVTQKVFIRGDYSSLGEEAPKAFPAILTASQPPITKGSGRLDLANWLTSREHPLTARVMANRIWYWHMGEGLVRTPDNFGKMGEAPSHPELLDYLATRFMQDGWSMKKLHKLIVLSSVYQMSSATTDGTVQADPENRLFSRFPRRRLSVEELRDGLLAIDGSIDLTMGGTLQKGFGTDGENSNDRLSIRPESVKRRLVYLPLRRANLPTLLNLFDFGDATSTLGKRPGTTIAPQALFMMNSEFVRERSQNLAQLALKEDADAARVRKLYLRVLGREPKADEASNAISYVAGFQKQFAGQRTAEDAWMSFSRILISSNEFIYLD